jgi:hypothetical protein
MSVKWNPRRAKYEVRWLEGGKHPSRLFDRKGDADAIDLEKKRQRQLGALAPTVMRSRITLAEFMTEDWWPRYAIPNLADDTRRRCTPAVGAGGRGADPRAHADRLVEPGPWRRPVSGAAGEVASS